MNQAISPLDQGFVKDVESVIFPDYNWRFLLENPDFSSHKHLTESLQNLGYSAEFIQTQIKAINQMEDEELISLALSNDVVYKAALGALQIRTSSSLMERAREMLQDRSADVRQLGVSMLTYNLGEANVSDIESALCQVSQSENDDGVLEALCYARFHLGLDTIRTHLRHLAAHPNPNVRFALTLAFWGSETPEDLEVLILLSADCDDEIREWALAGLKCSMELYCEEDFDRFAYLKEVYIGRLNDSSQMVRLEAIACLAKLKDATGLEALISELASGDVVYLTIESAITYANPILIPHLQNLREILSRDPQSTLVEDIDIAIESCKAIEITQAS